MNIPADIIHYNYIFLIESRAGAPGFLSFIHKDIGGWLQRVDGNRSVPHLIIYHIIKRLRRLLWATPSFSRPQPATDKVNGVRHSRSNWLPVIPTFDRAVPLRTTCTVQIGAASVGNRPRNLPHTRQPPFLCGRWCTVLLLWCLGWWGFVWCLYCQCTYNGVMYKFSQFPTCTLSPLSP